MTLPSEPPVDPEAPPVSAEAPGSAGVEDEIRQLARALGVQQELALQGRKAVVEAVSLGDNTTAPTVQVNLGGVSVPGVRLAASYTPVVGDTVLLLKQGNEFFAAFKIQDTGSAVASSLSGGFIKPTLNSGHSHNGNSGGDLMYRRVLDNGAWKIQWQGMINLGASDFVLSGANVLAAEYRPAVKRSLIAARQVADAVSIFVDFNTDGTVAVVGATEAPGGSSGSAGPFDVTHSHGGATGFAGDSHLHSHGGAVASTSFSETHSHTVSTSSFSVGSHSHSLSVSVARPTFVSFNGLEYFL